MLLPGDYLALLACLALTGLLVAGVLSRSRAVQALAYSIAVAIFAVHILDSRLDYLWATLVPHPAAVVLKLCAVWGALVAVLVGLSRHIERPSDRRALYIICLLVAGYGVYALVRQLTLPELREPPLWLAGTLIQSSESTCVAAAAATYLLPFGVELSEGAAARAGLISANGGTVTQGWRILKLHQPVVAEAVRIGRLDRGTVAAAPSQRFLTALDIGGGTGHAVVIQSHGPDTLWVQDPIESGYLADWAEFEPKWLRSCVWIEPPHSVSTETVQH